MNEQHENEPGFETGLATKEMEAGGVAAYAREQHELQAAFLVALNRPRDENKAFVAISKSCERPTFAEKARYSFPRGGAQVEGPSVNLAREMARIWGNIRHGIRIVSMDEDWVHVEGWALDLQTNTRVGNETKFKRLIFRKKGGWVRPDERDLRELVNKHGAICVRNALLQLMPADLIEDAMSKVWDTLDKAAKGELKQSREETIRRLVMAFDRIAVSVEMLERRLGHKLSEITPEELVELRGVYASIQDGQAKRAEYFESAEPDKQPAQGSIDPAHLKPGTPPTPKADKAKSEPPKAEPPKAGGLTEAEKQKILDDEAADRAADEAKTKEAPKKGRTLL